MGALSKRFGAVQLENGERGGLAEQFSIDVAIALDAQMATTRQARCGIAVWLGWWERRGFVILPIFPLIM